MLVDADNVVPARIVPVFAAIDEVFAGSSGGVAPGRLEVRIVVSGRPAALRRIEWPVDAEVLAHEGWQRADLALATAYVPSSDALVLVTGDGDFGLLAARHPGPVLVVSGAASGRLRDSGTVLDPAVTGAAPILDWLRAVLPTES